MNKLKPLFMILSAMLGGSFIGYSLTAMAGYYMAMLLMGVFLLFIHILNNQPVLISTACAAIAGGALTVTGLFPLPLAGLVSVWVTSLGLALFSTDQILKKN